MLGCCGLDRCEHEHTAKRELLHNALYAPSCCACLGEKVNAFIAFKGLALQSLIGAAEAVLSVICAHCKSEHIGHGSLSALYLFNKALGMNDSAVVGSLLKLNRVVSFLPAVADASKIGRSIILSGNASAAVRDSALVPNGAAYGNIVMGSHSQLFIYVIRPLLPCCDAVAVHAEIQL